MAQRFYQKASVQVAIVGAMGLIFATVVTIGHQRSELRLDNKNLQTKLADSQAALADVKAERDKYQTQLAPFLAVAERRFPDEPTDKRLELLLTRLDKAISDVQSAALKVSPERTLPPEVQQSLVAKLKSIPSLNIEITCIMGDAEGFALASQIKVLFDEAGWKVRGVNQSFFKQPIKRLVLTFGKTPSPQLLQALAPLFDGLAYPREAGPDATLGEDNLRILVGSK